MLTRRETGTCSTAHIPSQDLRFEDDVRAEWHYDPRSGAAVLVMCRLLSAQGAEEVLRLERRYGQRLLVYCAGAYPSHSVVARSWYRMMPSDSKPPRQLWLIPTDFFERVVRVHAELQTAEGARLFALWCDIIAACERGRQIEGFGKVPWWELDVPSGD